MGLFVRVYKTGGSHDATNGGISSTTSNICITNVDGPFEPDEEIPAALLVLGHAKGTVRIIGVDNRGDRDEDERCQQSEAQARLGTEDEVYGLGEVDGGCGH